MSYPLRVLLDCRKINHGGVGVHTRNIIEAVKGSVDLTLLVDKNSKPFLRQLLEDESKVIESSLCIDSYRAIYSLGVGRNLEEFDVYHSPWYLLPFDVNIASIITIHDTIQLTNPDRLYKKFVIKPIMKNALKRASVAITVSRCSRRNIVENFPYVADKVFVVPNALNPEFKRRAGMQGNWRLVQELDIDIQPYRYILCVSSTIKPHKGILDLVRVINELKLEDKSIHVPDVVLVTQDKGIPDVVYKTFKVVKDAGLDNLVELYRFAGTVVIPSLEEGFGIPLIEAKALGKSIVCRPVDSLIEVLRGLRVSGRYDVVSEDMSYESFKVAVKEGLAWFVGSDRCDSSADLSFFSIENIRTNLLSMYRDLVQMKKERRKTAAV